MARRLAISILLLLAGPSAAHAAEVSAVGGVLRYRPTAGKVSNVVFTETSTGIVEVTTLAGDDDGLTALGPECTPGPPVTCRAVASAVIDAGDMADRITAGIRDDKTGVFSGLLSITTTMTGGDGSDALAGGARRDSIDGGGGDDVIDGFAGDDTLGGGDGNDTISPNTGTDGISGGDGIDTVAYGFRVAPAFTLDGLANDGEADEDDRIGVDVENVTARASSGVATLVGDGRANRLTVMDGRGELTGGDGADILEGGPLDDSFHARDGAPDTIICNGGTDTVAADTIDSISPSCEIVSAATAPGGAFDDRPPALVWVSPAANGSLSANAAAKLVVSASDDRGVAKVRYYDDDRLVCEVTAAPFECAYAPRGGDVGRNTLIAVAVDGDNQTTSAVRVVNVRRFTTPAATLSLRPSRDRKAPYAFRATGRVARPAAVSPSQGCSGTITIRAKQGTKTLATHRTMLSRTCEYTTTLRLRSRLAAKLRLIARFGGNQVLGGRTAPARTVRLG